MKKVFLVLAAGLLVVSACHNKKGSATEANVKGATATQTEESKEEHNKQIVMASMKGIENHDVAAVLKDAAPDIVDYGDGSMSPVKGIDSVRAGLTRWMQAYPDVKGSNLKYAADGDWVVVWGDWSGTWKNDFMGEKATGKSFKVEDADIFRLNNAGKITEHHSIQSPMTSMMQVGAHMNDQAMQNMQKGQAHTNNR